MNTLTPAKEVVDLVAAIGVEHALLVADYIAGLPSHQRLWCDDRIREAVADAAAVVEPAPGVCSMLGRDHHHHLSSFNEARTSNPFVGPADPGSCPTIAPCPDAVEGAPHG